MKQPKEFDAPAAIKELADIEGPCQKCEGRGNVPNLAYPPDVAVVTCSDCDGARRIVPFEALRVKCDSVHPDWDKGWDAQTGHYPWRSHAQAGCPGWVSEPDLRVACWEVFKRLPNRIKQDIATNPYYAADNPKYPRETWEGIVLHEALAWAKEVANAN